MPYRRLPAALVAVIATALGSSAVAARAEGTGVDAWGQAASHATGDYFNPGESKLTPKTAAKIKARWSVPLVAAKCASPSTPLVGAKRLVTAAAYRITGYDASSGVLKWQTPDAGKRQIVLVAIVGGTVVAQYRDCHSGKAFVTALEAGTGKTIYTKPITALMYAPLVDKGILVGGMWDAEISNYGMRAYRISDGAQVWARQGSSFGGAAVSAGGRILVFGNNEPGAAVDISTGKRLWSVGTGCWTPIGASPDGGKFYLSCADGDPIRVASAATGKILASFPAYGSTSGFASDGKRIYLSAFVEGVLAVDANTGKKAWSATFDDNAPIEFSTGGGVVYGSRGGGHAVAAFTAKTGKQITLPAATSAIAGPPMIANGRLYGRTGASVTTYAP